jgi:hypothetical protein
MNELKINPLNNNLITSQVASLFQKKNLMSRRKQKINEGMKLIR